MEHLNDFWLLYYKQYLVFSNVNLKVYKGKKEGGKGVGLMPVVAVSCEKPIITTSGFAGAKLCKEHEKWQEHEANKGNPPL